MTDNIEHAKIIEHADVVLKSEGSDRSIKDFPSILDKSSSTSLYSIAPTGVAERIEQLPQSLLLLTEKQLKNNIPNDVNLSRVRIAFWKEYDSAQAEGRKIQWGSISRLVQRPSLIISEYFKDDYSLCLLYTSPSPRDH
jgi:hypothetical protein